MEELGPLYGEDHTTFREITTGFHQEYLTQTRQLAQDGAQVVVWPELAGIGVEEDVTDS